MKGSFSPRVEASADQVTRYLCVAARTDERFAEEVVSGMLSGDLRAVAPSVGFDLRPVLLHCLAARRQRYVRDGTMVVIGAVALILAPLWTVLSLALLVPLGGSIAQAVNAGGRFRTRAVMAAVTMVLIPCLLAVSITALASVAEESEEEGMPGWVSGWPWLALPFLLLLYGAAAWDLLKTRQVLVSQLVRAEFRGDSAPRPGPRDEWLEPMLSAIDQSQHGNVTVYSGFTPFVGHGRKVAGWSFALPTLRRGGTDREAVALDVLELIEHVRNRLRSIGPRQPDQPRQPQESEEPGQPEEPGEHAPDRLDALTLVDRVFVTGEALGSQERFLPRRDLPPRQNLAPEEIHEIATQPSGIARHYLCAEVPSWGGEVVASTFLNFSTDGRLLYLQCDRAVLEPLWRQYRDVDRLTATPPAGQLARLLLRAAGELPRTVFRAPGRVLRADLWGWQHRRRLNWTRFLAQSDLGYDYGAVFSVRQFAVGGGPRNYFQGTDAAKHLKIVERHVLAAVLDFLEEHEVDTTEFTSRQTMILNQGIVQTGGVSNVGNQAVGVAATATQQMTKPARSAPQETANA
jgi:hypothetical protein